MSQIVFRTMMYNKMKNISGIIGMMLLKLGASNEREVRKKPTSIFTDCHDITLGPPPHYTFLPVPYYFKFTQTTRINRVYVAEIVSRLLNLEIVR